MVRYERDSESCTEVFGLWLACSSGYMSTPNGLALSLIFVFRSQISAGRDDLISFLKMSFLLDSNPNST